MSKRTKIDFEQLLIRGEAERAERERLVKREFQRLLTKARDAAEGGEAAWSVQSTDDKIFVSMALNRHDWLTQMGYTIPEAIIQLEPELVYWIPDIAKIVSRDD